MKRVNTNRSETTRTCMSGKKTWHWPSISTGCPVGSPRRKTCQPSIEGLLTRQSAIALSAKRGALPVLLLSGFLRVLLFAVYPQFRGCRDEKYVPHCQ